MNKAQNSSEIHRRFIALVYKLTLAGPWLLREWLSRQMALLQLRARTFGTGNEAEAVIPRAKRACPPGVGRIRWVFRDDVGGARRITPLRSR